jgi:hypothetical protein
MVVRALAYTGCNAALFSGISARCGCLSAAIEAGVLWTFSGCKGGMLRMSR